MFSRTCGLVLFFIIITSSELFAQTIASRSDGENTHYYTTLHEAVAAIADNETSIDRPAEITLFADIVLDEPLKVADGAHIQLAAGGADRTIRRSANLMEYPVIWVTGENSSLTLGKPGMEHELVIDGGYLNEPPIQAHAPLAAVNGQDAKLIMLNNVTLQNNYNIADVLTTNHYQNGAGVFIRTVDDNSERQAEFIMKGGIIRGNTNSVNSAVSSGGGVLSAGFGIFTMEGGVIKGNTAMRAGGGVAIGSRASFRKTGGIVYGFGAPAGYRNTAMENYSSPKYYGHAVYVAIFNPIAQFRNDTVYENDNLSYTGVPRGNGVFGEGEKWDNPNKVFQRRLFIIIPVVLVLCISIFFIINITFKKQLLKTFSNNPPPEINLENFNLSPREKEICALLMTKLSMKQIASVLNLTYSGVTFHVRNLYHKMEVQSRTELIVKIKTLDKG
ncbi:MAG: LuxR family transcriptional regulator [Treponema sp.]|nr:LuxR family transcriptional regulator [Treponema sp.]